MPVDAQHRPDKPPKIISAEILSNPFGEIVPRDLALIKRWSTRPMPSSNRAAGQAERAAEEAVKASKPKGTKDFSLISFGDEAQEDDEQTTVPHQ